MCAPRDAYRLATSSAFTDSIPVFVNRTVEMLRSGLEASDALSWSEGWNDERRVNN